VVVSIPLRGNGRETPAYANTVSVFTASVIGFRPLAG